ncbi:MAG TPA: uracil-DNA glycosylase family protein, partial [Flavisolibacter sp.]|nr:uracil-DNA glycosylase family protein [Flavisolibacter sp.]
RRIFLGINPGRFGAGVTGVNFTASRQLTEFCGINHPFKKGTELSAEFIYDMIEAYGGVHAFYSHFFIGSVCPLGFVRNGKNLNYYDDKDLLLILEPFIISNLHRLLNFNVDRQVCYCIGGEKNYKYLLSLNERFKWFQRIVALPHPRFIMQYRRKQKDQFIQQYLQLIQE